MLCFTSIANRGPLTDRHLCIARVIVRQISPSWNVNERTKGRNNWTPCALWEQPGMPGIGPMVTSGVVPAGSKMPMHDTMVAKKAESTITSMIRLLFQSAYVLRTKKNSERVSDITPEYVKILVNIGQFLGFSFCVTAKHSSKTIRINGIYRVMI